MKIITIITILIIGLLSCTNEKKELNLEPFLGLHEIKETKLVDTLKTDELLKIFNLEKEALFLVEKGWDMAKEVGDTYNMGYYSNQMKKQNESLSKTKSIISIIDTTKSTYGYGYESIIVKDGKLRKYYIRVSYLDDVLSVDELVNR